MNDDSTRREIEGIDATTYAGKALLACQVKARGIFGEDFLNYRLVDFVSLMLIQNKFASKGIFVTDDNKEECFIKIIESGEEKLIEELEKFINLKDKIAVIESHRDEFYDIVKKLQILSDKEDREKVNQIVEDFLRR